MLQRIAVVVLLCWLIPIVANTQSTKVVPLEPQDAQAAASAYRALKEAERNYAELQQRIERKYLPTEFAKAEGERAKEKDVVYSAGYEFSEDFKYILPHAQDTSFSRLQFGSASFPALKRGGLARIQ